MTLKTQDVTSYPKLITMNIRCDNIKLNVNDT